MSEQRKQKERTPEELQAQINKIAGKIVERAVRLGVAETESSMVNPDRTYVSIGDKEGERSTFNLVGGEVDDIKSAKRSEVPEGMEDDGGNRTDSVEVDVSDIRKGKGTEIRTTVANDELWSRSEAEMYENRATYGSSTDQAVATQAANKVLRDARDKVAKLSKNKKEQRAQADAAGTEQTADMLDDFFNAA